MVTTHPAEKCFVNPAMDTFRPSVHMARFRAKGLEPLVEVIIKIDAKKPEASMKMEGV